MDTTPLANIAPEANHLGSISNTLKIAVLVASKSYLLKESLEKLLADVEGRASKIKVEFAGETNT